MITEQLLNPKSIVIIGGSNDIHKAGGKVLKNLIDNNYRGLLYVVNPKESTVQGIRSYAEVSMLPPVDLAILAVPARFCPDTVDILAHKKNTRADNLIAEYSNYSEAGVDFAASLDAAFFSRCRALMSSRLASWYAFFFARRAAWCVSRYFFC